MNHEKSHSSEINLNKTLKTNPVPYSLFLKKLFIFFLMVIDNINSTKKIVIVNYRIHIQMFKYMSFSFRLEKKRGCF